MRSYPYEGTLGLTFREIAGRDLLRVIGQVSQRSIQLTLSDHEMEDDERLEDNGPCRVSESYLEGSEYLCDSCLAGMSRHKDVLYVFGFRGRKLFTPNS